MKITDINILKEFTIGQSLENISMGKLGQVVLLVGKNGAGKTRLLKTLEYISNNYDKLSYFRNNSEKTRFRGISYNFFRYYTLLFKLLIFSYLCLYKIK